MLVFFYFQSIFNLQLASLANTRFVRHFPLFDKTNDVNYLKKNVPGNFKTNVSYIHVF